MNYNFGIILTFIILFQLVLLAVAMLQNAGKRISNRFFALFFFAQFITFSSYLIERTPQYINSIPYLFQIANVFWFVWAPTLYLAIRFESHGLEKFSWKQLLHYLPAACFAFYLIFAFHIKPVETKKDLLLNYSLLTEQFGWLVSYLMKEQVFAYNVFATISLERYARKVSFTTKQKKERLQWNRFILYTYFATCLIYDGYEFLVPSVISYQVSLYLDLIIFLSYFTAILFRAISSSHFSAPLEKERILTVAEHEAKKIREKLKDLMLSGRIFLELDISVATVANKLEIKEKQLSEVINKYYKQNFNEYINQYRLEEAKKLLIESKANGKTILEIVFASGFNSKSSFNQAFKSYTGVTPSQYKKLH